LSDKALRHTVDRVSEQQSKYNEEKFAPRETKLSARVLIGALLYGTNMTRIIILFQPFAKAPRKRPYNVGINGFLLRSAAPVKNRRSVGKQISANT
jgi:hypothetical protein